MEIYFSIIQSNIKGGKITVQKSMFEAKCDGCGRTAFVPFKPDPSKPVYCRECFEKRRAPRVRGYTGTAEFNPKQAWARRRGGVKESSVEASKSVFYKL